VGHRLVHGGKKYNQPIIITPSILEKLKSNNRLAPLHNPINLACITTCHEVLPNLKNVAVFDTGFYRTLPAQSFLYALPYNYYLEQGIRRYGFHGISHQFVVEQAALKIKKSLSKLKIISCHLGNGCSVTAVKYGQAVETSMGFTPLAGLMMGTRSGDIDPAIVLYLQSQLNLSPTEVDEILNKKSGLLGISGYSSDLRDILLACGYGIPGYRAPKKFSQKDKTMAKIALDMFIHNIIRYIGSYATVMGGVDYIVFTAGIGERNADIRRLIMKEVKKAFPQVKSLVIPTNEELMIARQVLKLIKH
jgi:acetate kinase